MSIASGSLAAPTSNRFSILSFLRGPDKSTMATTNALAAKSTIFTERPSDVDKCPWYVNTVKPETFVFPTPTSIGLPRIFRERALEYASTWVEHYYYELIQASRKEQYQISSSSLKDLCGTDIIKMLYHWYIAQFTIDYLNDVYPLTSHEYLASSGLVADLPKGEKRLPSQAKQKTWKNYFLLTRSTNAMVNMLKQHKAKTMLLACREQMNFHEAVLVKISKGHPEISKQIRTALKGFYDTVVTQFQHSQDTLFEDMTLAEYYDFRTLNAGGTMGFLRQAYLFQLVDTTDAPLGEYEQLQELSMVVGRNIALVNDLYGLQKDILTGDVNIILKHHHKQQQKQQEKDDISSKVGSRSSNTRANDMAASVQWAVDEIVETVRYIENYNARYPHNLETKYNIAMGCVSGNHGAHSTCERYELPPGFEWPESISNWTCEC